MASKGSFEKHSSGQPDTSYPALWQRDQNSKMLDAIQECDGIPMISLRAPILTRFHHTKRGKTNLEGGLTRSAKRSLVLEPCRALLFFWPSRHGRVKSRQRRSLHKSMRCVENSMDPFWFEYPILIFALQPGCPHGTHHGPHHGTQAKESFSEPFYPSPWMNPHAEGWEVAYQKAHAFVSQLTVLEKINLTTGVG